MVTISVAKCDGCSVEVRGNAPPEEWTQLREPGQPVRLFCHPSCMLSSKAGITPASRGTHWGLDSTDVVLLETMALGYSNAQIGDQIGLSASTIKNRSTCIADKLGTHNRMQSLLMAARLGIVELPGVLDLHTTNREAV